MLLSKMQECKCIDCIPECLKNNKCECNEANQYLKGSSYTWIVLLMAFTIVSILYTVLSIPLSYTFDIMLNMDIFNLERRAATAEILQFGWAAIPIVFLLTIIGYGITKSLEERSRY